MSYKEWSSSTTREYAGISNNQFFLAVEKLFLLDYGNELSLKRMNETIFAKRNRVTRTGWWIFKSTNYHVDSWRINISPTKDGTKITIQANYALSAGKPIPDSVMMPGMPVHNTEIYDQFWVKLDYLLKNNDNTNNL